MVEESIKTPIIFNQVNLTHVSKINCCTTDCAICLNSLEIGCIECINKNILICPSIKGTCNHGYHEHCISKWLEKHFNCPLDNKQWVQVNKF